VEELGNWLNELERRRDWLAGQGCDYLLVIVPEKSTIYPELMPANVPRFGQKTRLDQLVAYVEDNSDLQILDLREALLLGRSQRETYYRTDTHWNGWGAFIASERILLRLAERHPGIRPYAETDYWFREQERSGGDLARLLALGDVLTDQRILAVLRVPTRAGEAPTGVAPEPNLGPWGQPQAWESSLEDAPTVVVFSDSFGAALVPFLSEHFRRSLYLVRFGVDETVILRERPDIVVQELAERELQRAAPPNDIVELAYE
jgi:hypothetical protein